MDKGKLEASLMELKQRFGMDERIIDLTLGRISARDTAVEVNGIVFHIPTLDEGYVLWKCLWPDCHNCCENQGRLPLTINDIEEVSKAMNLSKEEFIKNETRVAEWEEEEPFGSAILTMLALKRSKDEDERHDGKPLKCRFLKQGYCTLHPSRPGCCKLYPFASWVTINDGKQVIHATFQFDGNCPGFFISDSIYDMKDTLEEYSKIILDYNNAVNRTVREGYGSITIING